jgi:NAD(P)H-hydrate epimerase
MQAIERQADASGLSYAMMMEIAGLRLAQVVSEVYGHLSTKRVCGLVGSGNNGGDTLVALEHLVNQGWVTSAYLVRKRPSDDPLVERLRAAGGKILTIEDDSGFRKLAEELRNCTILLDGVLGTGIQLPVRGKLAEALLKTRQELDALPQKPVVVAVDCPSGVDCDSGEVAAECIPADLTVTMAAVKTGLLRFPANNLIGKLRVVGIGLEQESLHLEAWQSIKRRVAEEEMVRRSLPDRPRDAHKGTFGTALVVAGSVNYTGAALLAGKAAYRCGAGLVTLAVPAPLHAILAGQIPEATWLILPHEMGVIAAEAAEVILENLERATGMLIGPGLGLEDETRDFLVRLIGSVPQGRRAGIGFVPASSKGGSAIREKLPPLVVDADGLKLLARLPDWAKHLPAPAILTPHPGEMAILTGLQVDDIQAHRIEVAERYAQEWGHVVVLKGANSVVSAPDGRTVLIPVASAALARAGTGDVLAGLIVGLRAQGMGAFEAAVSGSWIHAESGLRAARTLGSTAAVVAGDVLEAVVGVMGRMED